MAYLPGREVSQQVTTRPLLNVAILTQEQMKHNKNVKDELTDVNELVFFGRMETRKGLELFADALDRLSVTRPEFAGTKRSLEVVLGREENNETIFFHWRVTANF